jgi:hypothetical protein
MPSFKSHSFFLSVLHTSAIWVILFVLLYYVFQQQHDIKVLQFQLNTTIINQSQNREYYSSSYRYSANEFFPDMDHRISIKNLKCSRFSNSEGIAASARMYGLLICYDGILIVNSDILIQVGDKIYSLIELLGIGVPKTYPCNSNSFFKSPDRTDDFCDNIYECAGKTCLTAIQNKECSDRNNWGVDFCSSDKELCICGGGFQRDESNRDLIVNVVANNQSKSFWDLNHICCAPGEYCSGWTTLTISCDGITRGLCNDHARIRYNSYYRQCDGVGGSHYISCLKTIRSIVNTDAWREMSLYDNFANNSNYIINVTNVVYDLACKTTPSLGFDLTSIYQQPKNITNQFASIVSHSCTEKYIYYFQEANTTEMIPQDYGKMYYVLMLKSGKNAICLSKHTTTKAFWYELEMNDDMYTMCAAVNFNKLDSGIFDDYGRQLTTLYQWKYPHEFVNSDIGIRWTLTYYNHNEYITV